MAEGPGKYDEFAHELLLRTKATGLLLVVLGGTRGHGVSAKIASESDEEYRSKAKALAYLLREIAKDMDHNAAVGPLKTSTTSGRGTP